MSISNKFDRKSLGKWEMLILEKGLTATNCIPLLCLSKVLGGVADPRGTVQLGILCEGSE